MGAIAIIKRIRRLYLRRMHPIAYAKLIGVNMGDVHIYGHVSWNTEPWIIKLGNNVHITDGVKFITRDGGTLLFRDRVPDLEITKPIIVGDNVYIGNNAIILPGVNIGSNVVIGAGAIVSRNIPSNCVAVGIPARPIKTIDEYYEKLQKESLHLGHLKAQEKDRALMDYYNYKGNTDGIYS